MVQDGSGNTNGMQNGITVYAKLGDDRTTLIGMLRRQRDLVAWKVGRASDEALRTGRTSGGLSLHGIVRHLENVERWWFRERFAGETGLTYDWTDEDEDGEFHVPDDVRMQDLVAAYKKESALGDAIIDAAPTLDARSAAGDFSLRWVISHMIEETARHLGHIDLLREQADGEVGDQPR